MDNKTLTIYEKLRCIRKDYLLADLRSDKERQFVCEMAEGLKGLGDDICDEDITEYLTKNQIAWIEDIYKYLVDS